MDSMEALSNQKLLRSKLALWLYGPITNKVVLRCLLLRSGLELTSSISHIDGVGS